MVLAGEDGLRTSHCSSFAAATEHCALFSLPQDITASPTIYRADVATGSCIQRQHTSETRRRRLVGTGSLESLFSRHYALC